jgi:hypothetical protein
MNGRTAIADWEVGSDSPQPQPVVEVLGRDEKLLWTAAVRSTVSAGPLGKIGAVGLISVCLLGPLAPWGEPMDVFCPPGEPPSCRKFYVSVFLLIFWTGGASLTLLWMAWKARYRPWLWHCAVTTTRALLVDGRGPRLAGAVDLTRHPPLKDHAGRLAFGRKPIRLASFGALTPLQMQRAIFWATEGRGATTAKDAGE